MHVILAKEMDAVQGGLTWMAASEALSSKADIGASGESSFGVDRKDLLEDTRRSVVQGWDCSQAEDVLEEGDATD